MLAASFPEPSIDEYDDTSRPVLAKMSDAQLAERLAWYDARHEFFNARPEGSRVEENELSRQLGLNAVLWGRVHAEVVRRDDRPTER
jgi:hypothetical protein